MKFSAKIIPAGNANGFEVPQELMKALGPEARPPVLIQIKGHSWRSRVAIKNGKRLVGISAANRLASKIEAGEIVSIELTKDTKPRVVDLPKDLAKALRSKPLALAAFERLAFGLKGRHIRILDESKTPETRKRRIEKLVASLGRPSR